MSQKLRISLLLGLLFTLMAGVITAEAQGRPTPTPTSVRGHISGVVYEDVNSDGVCVNSGVAGEEPLVNINIDFINSNGEKLVTLQSGEGGIYSLVQAGESYWEIHVDPDNTWRVTSENPLYVPIYADSLVQTDVNFCIQKADTYAPSTPLPIISPPALLPEAGASAQSGNIGLLLVAITGMGLVLLGTGLKARERAVARKD